MKSNIGSFKEDILSMQSAVNYLSNYKIGDKNG
jgi:hypothetical protein